MAEFKVVETVLRGLMAKVSPDGASVGVEEAEEFIDVDEYGLALESLAHELVEHGRSSTDDEPALVREITARLLHDLVNRGRE